MMRVQVDPIFSTDKLEKALSKVFEQSNNTKYILQLRTAMEKSTAIFDKEKAQERLSKLSGGVAVFKVCYSPL